MSMTRVGVGVASLALLVVAGSGCWGRLFSEGVGVVTGARGKVVVARKPGDLTRYRGLRLTPVTVAPELEAPAAVPGLIREALFDAAHKSGLTPTGTPALVLTAEVIHYESGGIVDTAIGPLDEVIVRARLNDAQSNAVVAEANLLGRSKATTSSGAENLSKGIGKAFRSWLKDAGFGKDVKDED
jgi:hypothetical protein